MAININKNNLKILIIYIILIYIIFTIKKYEDKDNNIVEKKYNKLCNKSNECRNYINYISSIILWRIAVIAAIIIVMIIIMYMYLTLDQDKFTLQLILSINIFIFILLVLSNKSILSYMLTHNITLNHHRNKLL